MSAGWEYTSARWDGDNDYLSKGNQRLYLESAGDHINELEAQLAEVRKVAKEAVEEWREVLDNDFCGMTGGSTTDVTERLAKVIEGKS